MQNCKNLLCFLVTVMCAFTGIAQTNRNTGKTTVPKTVQTTVTPVNTNTVTAANTETAELHLGRYELYSGIPSIYLGHFILLANGKYKVAFNTDEENYDERGAYVYHSDTNTIEWKAGMFRSNNWGGKIVKTEKGFRIQFNKATYGDSK
ncbi:MAG: hypothetical protein V4557_16200 [Bacteroidota bacterium]